MGRKQREKEATCKCTVYKTMDHILGLGRYTTIFISKAWRERNLCHEQLIENDTNFDSWSPNNMLPNNLERHHREIQVFRKIP